MLLRLLGKLLWLLLLLLEVSEVLVKILGVELFSSRSVGVEVCCIEDRSPGSLLLLSVVGKVLSLSCGISLSGNLLLLVNDTLLECQHCFVSLLLQLEGRVSLVTVKDKILKYLHERSSLPLEQEPPTQELQDQS